jgi:RNase P/RNase MRP subunit POP5
VSPLSRPKKQRYIGFKVEVPSEDLPPRPAMVEAIDRACDTAGLPTGRRLTVYDGQAGILKGTAKERDALLEALASITEIGGVQARVETVITSGTIKKVKGLLGFDRGR